jgi:hypothetical protein
LKVDFNFELVVPKDKNQIPMMNLSLDQTPDEGEDEDNFNSPKDSDRDSLIQPRDKDNYSDERDNVDYYENDSTKLKQ